MAIENIFWHDTVVTKQAREKLSGQKSALLWFTGLSGSGKSTLANAVEVELFKLGYRTYLLDGDNIRSGLNKNLTFTEADRKENIRRIGEVAKLFVDSNAIVLASFISPFIEDRKQVRDLVEDDEFIEVYVKCSLDACEQRDPKGLYEKVRSGDIKNFTGIDSPYQAPESPELVVETENASIEVSTQKILKYLADHHMI